MNNTTDFLTSISQFFKETYREIKYADLYKNKETGIQIGIPENWSRISTDRIPCKSDFPYEEIDPPENGLYLGYRRPNTESIAGVFIFSVEPPFLQDAEFELFKLQMREYRKIQWKNKECYHASTWYEIPFVSEEHIIVVNGRVVRFEVIQREYGAATSILDNIFFE